MRTRVYVVASVSLLLYSLLHTYQKREPQHAAAVAMSICRMRSALRWSIEFTCKSRSELGIEEGGGIEDDDVNGGCDGDDGSGRAAVSPL